MKILWNGAIIDQEDVQVSPLDRGYHFGDGIYEVYRVYNGAFYERDAHNERLERSAKGIKITLPWSIPQFNAWLDELLAANAIVNGSVYLQITRGAASRSHPFPKNAEPVTLGFCSHVERPLDSMRAGISAITLPDIRWLRCDMKTLNLLPNVMAKQEALDAGAQEAIMHRDGTVTECSASNLFIVKDGRLLTHPANNLILHGITRMVVLRLAQTLAIPAEERAFTLDELRNANEAFIAGTTVEITPVIQVDQQPIGAGTPGPLTKRLQEAFETTLPPS
ncbi:D-amino-acid transaminase [Paenibacillus turpanensis]|uniref:D-amino-acid transaminase n=1 Tax=Paenibacillus turpanensis TaxID=2689078 RepID=UPI00140D718E